jgi:hypothetical protein
MKHIKIYFIILLIFSFSNLGCYSISSTRKETIFEFEYIDNLIYEENTKRVILKLSNTGEVIY